MEDHSTQGWQPRQAILPASAAPRRLHSGLKHKPANPVADDRIKLANPAKLTYVTDSRQIELEAAMKPIER